MGTRNYVIRKPIFEAPIQEEQHGFHSEAVDHIFMPCKIAEGSW